MMLLIFHLQFIFNLMASGKKTNNAPTEEFILEAPAPVDVAAKVSAIYRALSVEVNASNFIYRKTYSFM